jgi:hypothetical protein
VANVGIDAGFCRPSPPPTMVAPGVLEGVGGVCASDLFGPGASADARTAAAANNGDQVSVTINAPAGARLTVSCNDGTPCGHFVHEVGAKSRAVSPPAVNNANLSDGTVIKVVVGLPDIVRTLVLSVSNKTGVSLSGDTYCRPPVHGSPPPQSRPRARDGVRITVVPGICGSSRVTGLVTTPVAA